MSAPERLPDGRFRLPDGRIVESYEAVRWVAEQGRRNEENERVAE